MQQNFEEIKAENARLRETLKNFVTHNMLQKMFARVMTQVNAAAQSPSAEEVREVARHETLELLAKQKIEGSTTLPTVRRTILGRAPGMGPCNYDSSANHFINAEGQNVMTTQPPVPAAANLAYLLEPVGRGVHLSTTEVIDPAMMLMMSQFSDPIRVHSIAAQNTAQVNALNVGSAMQQLPRQISCFGT